MRPRKGEAHGQMETLIAASICILLIGFTAARAFQWRGPRVEQPFGGPQRGVSDCNFDAIPDGTGIAFGVSEDCNGNGVPDECDIDSGASVDCNGNGVPDECEQSTQHGLNGTYAGLFIGIPPDNFELLDNFEPFQVVRGRIDPTVDFDWGGGEPWTGFDNDNFTVRWEGYVVTPAISGSYTFYTRTDDGVRLWVDGQLIIDQYNDQPPTEHSGVITLNGGETYRIVMDYYENGTFAVAELRWEPPGQPKVIIPTGNLIPYLDCNGNGQGDDCDIAFGVSTDNDGNGIPDECEVCVGDTDGDRDVDLTDLAVLLSQFDMTGPGLAGDVDFDEDVDLTDLAILLSAFDSTCN